MTRLALSPMLQRAIAMPELSAIELRERLYRELQENPLLEEAPPDDTPEADAGPAKVRLERFARAPTSLADHLLEQLRFRVVSPAVRAAAEEIIASVDEDGYLGAAIQEIAARRAVPEAVVETALRIVQGFDPPGVAARDLRECLLLQVRDPDRRHPVHPVTIAIVERHFEALQRGTHAAIARALHVVPQHVREAVYEIQSLDPKPARSFGLIGTQYRVPDVAVQKVGEDFVVTVTEEGIPRLRIDPGHRALLEDEGSRRYVQDRFRSATCLLMGLAWRHRTLHEVTQSIVRLQRDFLDKGFPHLQPLSLRDVAEDVGWDEITVWRVTAGKFVDTPQGIFPLRFLRSAGRDNPPGGESPPDPGWGPPAPAAAAAGALSVAFDWTEAVGRRARAPRPRIVGGYATGR